MIFEFLALFLGVIAGTITGLIPGIHINLVAIFLVSSSAFFLKFTSPLSLAIFIVSMSITHTFLDFIPSILLGAPDEDTSLSILPGHELLLKGRGYEAIIYTLYGSIIAIPIILLFTPLFIFILPKIFFYLKFIMFFILVFISSYLIIREENKLLAFLIFLLSGFLGLATLNLSLKESLLPLLTGLFGSSSLITSIIKKEKIPKQKILNFKKIKPKIREIKNSIIATILASPLCSFLPALGSSQAAVIGSDMTKEKNKKEFLILLGSINTIVMGLSFVTLYSIQATRTGSAVAVQKILENFTPNNLIIILATIIFSSILASFLTIFLARFFSKNVSRINYKYLSMAVLIFLAVVVFIFSNFLGLLIFIIATFTGLAAILLKVRRTNLMGCLMLPSILLYLPI